MKNYVDLQSFIDENNINAKIIKKGSTQATLDACEALRNLGYEVSGEQFIKAIIMVAEKQDKTKVPIIAMVRGTDKINLFSVKDIVQGIKIRIPDPNEAQSICSYPRGGTPPIGFCNINKVIIDENLVKPSKTLYGGGGDTEHLIVIHSEELIKYHIESSANTLIVDKIAEILK